MSPDTTKPGLRERKKARTRATLRTEAFRLFREQGYHETTIEQIAEAADVSPSTFFRYFPTKEQLVLVDDIDPIMLAAIDEVPLDVPPITAIRQAAEYVLATLPPEEMAFERERQQLLYSVPELKRAVMLELVGNVDLIAGIVAKRTGRSTNDFEVRALSGAMVGSVLGVLDQRAGDISLGLRAMAYLDDGLPLGRVVP